VSAHVSIDPQPGWRSPLRRIEWVLDRSDAGQSTSGASVRAVLGVLFAAYGIALLAVEVAHNDFTPLPLFFLVFAVPMFTNRLGRFGRYFLPVLVGLVAYGAAAKYATQFKLHVHYTQQIDLDRLLTGGNEVPTAWLQQHLYRGHTGPLEAVAVAAYAGHFLVPLALGAGLVLLGRTRTFTLLTFSILIAAMAAMVVFILMPTAPPWLAAQRGYVDGVHHILKQALYDLHMSSLGAVEGDPTKYDVTAAVPSLHTTFPFLCLLAARHARLPRWVVGLLALNLLAVVFSIVYTGEHYVVDAAAGALLAVTAWHLVQRLESRAQRRRVARDAAVSVQSRLA
jgi:membrane-associated phospholipid phosphatase